MSINNTLQKLALKIIEKEYNNLNKVVIFTFNKIIYELLKQIFSYTLKDLKLTEKPNIYLFSNFFYNILNIKKINKINSILKIHTATEKVLGNNNGINYKLRFLFEIYEILFSDFEYTNFFKLPSEIFSNLILFKPEKGNNDLLLYYIKDIFLEYEKTNIHDSEMTDSQVLKKFLVTDLSSSNFQDIFKNNKFYFIGYYFLNELQKQVIQKIIEGNENKSVFINEYFKSPSNFFIFNKINNLIDETLKEITNKNCYEQIKIEIDINKKPDIEVHTCINSAEQAEIIINNISDLIKQNNNKFDEICILLLDDFLLPFLIQKFIQKNIPFILKTGYNITFTNAYNFFNTIIDIYYAIQTKPTQEKYITTKELNLLYYYNLFDFKELKNVKDLYLTLKFDDIKEKILNNDLINFLEDDNLFLNSLINILNNKKEEIVINSKNNFFDYVELLAYNKIIEIINSIKNYKLSKNDLLFILKEMIKDEKIEIDNNNIKGGIIILKKFDTRFLNFKYVFIPSFIEDFWPKLNEFNKSFLLSIPEFYEFFEKYKQHQYFLETYLFFRFLGSAEKLFLFIPKFVNKEEKFESQYLDFLKILYSEIKGSFTEKHHIPSLERQIEYYNELVISKDNDSNLESFIKNIKTSSRINIEHFVECPLKFYFYYVKDLNKNILLPTYLSNLENGLIVHELLRLWLNNKNINPSKPFSGLSEFSTDHIISIFKKVIYKNKDIHILPIEYLIIVNEILTIIKRFEENIENILNSKEYTKIKNAFKYNNIKTECTTLFEFNNIKLKGNIDCIISDENTTYIIEHKFSKKNQMPKNFKIKYIEKPDTFNSYWFQLIFYNWLLYRRKNINDIENFLIFIKENSNDALFKLEIKKEELQKAFSFIEELINRIFNHDLIFKQTTYTNICSNYFSKCDFYHFCNVNI